MIAKFKKAIPQNIKNIYHLGRSVIAATLFGFPGRKLTVIGVTGTNGKTTTTQMIGEILCKGGKKVAVYSTINFQVNDKNIVNKTKFTTASAWHLQKFIKKAVKAGCEYLVLEVSSHSLDQHRVWGIDFSIGVITNVTREHLDYHHDMKQYRLAKKKLFKLVSVSPRKQKTIIVNLDMENPEEFLGAARNNAKKIGYSMNDKNNGGGVDLHIHPDSIVSDLSGSKFSINDIEFNLQLVGEFNVENALAAICVGDFLGIDYGVMSKALAGIKKVPGRMDRVENDRGFEIIIDYALTPDSMEKIGKLMQELRGEGKLIWVFGSCGDRDRGKRPIMGRIVAEYSDYAIVTNEDPYDEDPQQIIDEVFSGVKKGKIENENAWRIMDRKEAIEKAVNLASEGDVVLITGKGAEEVMMIKGKHIPWNDKKVVEEILKNK